jgi:hypothetical protein
VEGEWTGASKCGCSDHTSIHSPILAYVPDKINLSESSALIHNNVHRTVQLEHWVIVG